MLWSPNTQLLYPFENQANDYSGNARHGTLGGTPPCTYATRPNAGRCLYFPGTGYVSTPSFGLSGTVVVFAANIRYLPSTLVHQTLIADGYSGTIGMLYLYCIKQISKTLRWLYADGTGAPAASAINFFLGYEDIWLHLCVVCDYAGKKTYFYRNGVPFDSPVSMSGTPVFPSTIRAKYIGTYPEGFTDPLTDGYLQKVYLGTLATCPPVPVLTANANRLMLGMNPIW